MTTAKNTDLAASIKDLFTDEEILEVTEYHDGNEAPTTQAGLALVEAMEDDNNMNEEVTDAEIAGALEQPTGSDTLDNLEAELAELHAKLKPEKLDISGPSVDAYLDSYNLAGLLGLKELIKAAVKTRKAGIRDGIKVIKKAIRAELKAAKAQEKAATKAANKAAKAQYVRTVLQLKIASELMEDVNRASAPATLADKLGVARGSVKSYLRRLRENDILTTDGIDPFTKAFNYTEGANWDRFISETEDALSAYI